jgi:hypothetical protein
MIHVVSNSFSTKLPRKLKKLYEKFFNRMLNDKNYVLLLFFSNFNLNFKESRM